MKFNLNESLAKVEVSSEKSWNGGEANQLFFSLTVMFADS